MTEVLLRTFVTTLYFLALINPVSKVSVLAVLSSAQERTDFMRVTAKASLVAGGILLGSMIRFRSCFRLVSSLRFRVCGGIFY